MFDRDRGEEENEERWSSEDGEETDATGKERKGGAIR